ncbi:hypothetical protein N9L06_07415 [Mariniblastus sp.]|nr:hypothetical protein [Mariniblastus sp.]
MIQTPENTIKIRDYVESVYRNRGKLLLYNLAIILLTVGVILVWPREYRSEAKLWMKIGRENSRLDPTASTGETISIQENDREDEIKSVIDIMGSRGVAEGTVDLLGPEVVLGDEPLPGSDEEEKKNVLADAFKSTFGSLLKMVKQIDPISDREEAVQEIIEHMQVFAERKSNVVSVVYDTDSPELAQAVVESMIDQFKATHARIHMTEGSLGFFEDQLKQLKVRVNNTSDKLRISKDKLGLASIEGHRTMLESQMESVRDSRLSVERRLAEATASANELKTQLDSHPAQMVSSERMVPNTGRDSIRDQLYSLEVERMELESMFSENNPKLLAIKKQEAAARRTLAKQTTKARKEMTRSVNSVHQDLALQLSQAESVKRGLQAMLESLKKQDVEVLAEISALNRSSVEIQQQERDVELAVTNYMGYAENLEDARVDEALSKNAFSNVSIAQPATLEEKPITPSKLVVGLLGLASMLFGSLAIIAGALLMNNSVHRQSDVSNLVDAPVIVSIPDKREFRHVMN